MPICVFVKAIRRSLWVCRSWAKITSGNHERTCTSAATQFGRSLFATLQRIGILYFGRFELMSSFVRSFCVIQTSDPLIRNSQIEPVDGKLGFVGHRVGKP